MAVTGEDLIDEARRRLMAAAPDAEIILFGSRAHDGARPDSDLDLIVIERDFARRGEEYGRLRKELRGLGVAIDLVIYRRREADLWCGVPGSFLRRALGEGRVLADHVRAGPPGASRLLSTRQPEHRQRGLRFGRVTLRGAAPFRVWECAW